MAFGSSFASASASADYDTDSAAACAYVRSGALNDTEKFQGLAHFTEHMLFLGTNNRPENSYTQLLTENGGSRNAATSEDATFFYFDVRNHALAKVLELFSEFFKSPTFSESGTAREINAIDSEFRKNFTSELRRVWQIEKSAMTDSESALNKFPTGNSQSLPNETEEEKAALRQALKEYHQDCYSSNIMSLVLIGNYDLDELE